MAEAASIWRGIAANRKITMPPQWRVNLARAEQFLEQNCGIGQL
jgi:hypothetical protein